MDALEEKIMNQNNRGFELLDILTILSFAMQVENYEELQNQTTTDDIFKELQRQDREYLDQIVANQERILGKLSILMGDES